MVVADQVGDVAVVRMCDPSRSNALTPAMVLSVTRAISEAKGRALVVHSEGRNFCSGGDHDSFLELSPTGRRQHLAEIKELMITVRAVQVPTVACVQGAVIGGGLELALHCDLIVAADDARFQLPHVATGSKMRRTSYAALVDRTGIGFARRMSLLGDLVPAPSALAAGLVDHVSRAADLYPTAMSIAAQLAAQPQDMMEHARQALAGAVTDPAH
ncbi:enoyl-CoA hydratase/isomerase family protein [Nocardioides sp. LS1]|uniref:enoyl-CoA hydratase/isomerase family protein n=1 Tax=Nocardioides sp. LS1 TaxID=1027620 RepID=UPI000FF9B9D4|nr:enoyl-CoA hydratase/isomerase family protein [Nocardioides sp. LS1]GCD90144.1 enoyl-CoA hydratase [Nocardioides sp. LS1]